MRRLGLEMGRDKLHRALDVDRRQLLAHARILALLQQEMLRLGRCDFLNPAKQFVDRSELCDQLPVRFSPMPLTPGILSLVSPINPMISTTRAGSTPNRTNESASLNHFSFTGS